MNAGQLKERPCRKGHTDVIRQPSGKRRCRTCAREWRLQYEAQPEIRERLHNQRVSPEGREYWAKWRDRNREVARRSGRQWMHARRLKEQFGLDREDYQAMLDNQGGVCAICKMPPIEDYALSIDHDHTTGIIRGLLCRQCNLGIGNLRDDPRLLRAALRYLKVRG